MEKKTYLDAIQPTQTGTLQVRFALDITDGTELIKRSIHRIAINPDSRIADLLEANSQHIVAMGYPAISNADRNLIDATAASYFTAEMTAAYEQMKQAAA